MEGGSGVLGALADLTHVPWIEGDVSERLALRQESEHTRLAARWF